MASLNAPFLKFKSLPELDIPPSGKRKTLFPAAGHAGDGLPSRRLFSQNSSPAKVGAFRNRDEYHRTNGNGPNGVLNEQHI